MVYGEFKESLQRDRDGSYVTCLPWKSVHPLLKDNAASAKARLDRLLKKMKRDPKSLQQYHNIIQDQSNLGIVEPSPIQSTENNVFYLPHHLVIKESAETTKMRIA